MPYILPEDREQFEVLEFVRPKNAGELNFCISTMLANYIEDTGRRYQNMNDIVGALEGAKAEFQRVVVAPYEDKKMAENGGVYGEQDTGVIGLVNEDEYGVITNGNHDETRD